MPSRRGPRATTAGGEPAGSRTHRRRPNDAAQSLTCPPTYRWGLGSGVQAVDHLRRWMAGSVSLRARPRAASSVPVASAWSSPVGNHQHGTAAYRCDRTRQQSATNRDCRTIASPTSAEKSLPNMLSPAPRWSAATEAIASICPAWLQDQQPLPRLRRCAVRRRCLSRLGSRTR